MVRGRGPGDGQRPVARGDGRRRRGVRLFTVVVRVAGAVQHIGPGAPSVVRVVLGPDLRPDLSAGARSCISPEMAGITINSNDGFAVFQAGIIIPSELILLDGSATGRRPSEAHSVHEQIIVEIPGDEVISRLARSLFGGVGCRGGCRLHNLHGQHGHRDFADGFGVDAGLAAQGGFRLVPVGEPDEVVILGGLVQGQGNALAGDGNRGCGRPLLVDANDVGVERRHLVFVQGPVVAHLQGIFMDGGGGNRRRRVILGAGLLDGEECEGDGQRHGYRRQPQPRLPQRCGADY